MTKIIDNYTLEHSIGQGQYGKVYKAFHTQTKHVVAVKVIKLERFKQVPKLNDFTINEINTLQLVKNDNVIQFVEMLRTVNNIYLVYQYCNGGNLEELIQKYGPLKEELALEYFSQLLNAFEVLTRENILHRDLKPSNILLHDGVIKIADFGFCKTLQGQMDLTQTMVGSPIYMAPEVLKGEPYSLQADIWSLGVCLFEMLFAKCPFEDVTIPRLMFQIQTKQVEIPHQIQKVGELTEWLLKRMLTVDPSRRITWQQLFDIQRSGKEIQNIQLFQQSPNKLQKQPQMTQKSPLLSPRHQTRYPDPQQQRLGTIIVQIPDSRSRNNLNQPSANKFTRRSPSPIAVRERGQSPMMPWGGSRTPKQEPQGFKSNELQKTLEKTQKTRELSINRIQSISSQYINSAEALLQRSKHHTVISSSALTQKDELKYSPYITNKHSYDSSDTQKFLPNPNSPDENLRWNLRVVLSKRNKIIDDMKTLASIIEINDQSFVPALPFLIIKYIQKEIERLYQELYLNHMNLRSQFQQPDSWNILGKWLDFRLTPQFLKCQQIVTKEFNMMMLTTESFKKEIKRQNTNQDQQIYINTIDNQTQGQLKLILLKEGIRYTEILTDKINRLNDIFIIKKLQYHQKMVLELLIEVGKWRHVIPNMNDDQQPISNIIYQIKSLYQSLL